MRKALEISLVKSIEESLNKHNPGIARKISKTSKVAAKYIAKKFYKVLKSEPKKEDVKSKASLKKEKKIVTNNPSKTKSKSKK